MLQTAELHTATEPEADRSTEREPLAHPRLLAQRAGHRTKKRHLRRAIRRIACLIAVDLSFLWLVRETLDAGRSFGAVGTMTTWLFPAGLLQGFGSFTAIVVGLAVAGAYASEQRWAVAPTVLKGMAFGAALALWQSIDAYGVGWTLTHWAAFVLVFGGVLALARWALWAAVVRYRLAAKPEDRVILVGDPEGLTGRQALDAVVGRPGWHSLGWLSERGDIDDYLGHPSAVWEVLCETGTDTVVLCGDVRGEMFDSVVEAAAVAGCRVLSIKPRGMLMTSQPRTVGNGRLRMLELTFPAGRAGQDLLKRGFDILVSGTLLVVLSPILALVALAIKLDSSGPVFFVQERVGRAGRVFPMLKFRTMDNGADSVKDELAHMNASGDPRLFKIPDDPRVTRVGRFLRRWSLDELPQLWNVLRGEMSLVGPRPFFEADLAAYDDHHFIRLTVKPGLTGMWQVKGRSTIVDFEEVVNLDREYVEKWSFYLDLRILLATLPAVVRRTGAY
jgi:exopolysaccharide biosynthesis polyprenyl glycosylphosphotransferase